MIEKLFKELPSSLSPQNLSLNKGEMLFKQGDCVNNLYFIIAGKIKLVRSTCDGTLILLHLGQQGESIAEASLFSDQYHCSAIVETNCTLCFVKKRNLLQFLQQNPKMMLKLLAIFSRQIRDLRSINEIKNIRSAKMRILAFLENNMDENKEIALHLTLKDIAHKIGLAHETFYRELKKLEASGKLQRNKDRIRIV